MGNIEEPASNMQMNGDELDSIIAPENGISTTPSPVSMQKKDSL